MKILVTGGAGFIGSALVRHLVLNTRHTVINLDKLTYAGNLLCVEEVASSEKYSFEHVDICDRSKLEQVFDLHKPEAVMHLAAESHVDRSIKSPKEFIDTNIIGTFNLLETSRQYWGGLDRRGMRTFRFHHVSTDEVYGDLDSDEDLFSEETAYAPSSPYSASKASSDHLVRAWHRTYNLPVLVTNCSNNYGPYHYPEKLIPLMILNAIGRKPLPIYGTGKQVRDWLYVDDHARALATVLTKGRIGETYNIGGHNEMTNIAVVRTICDLLDDIIPREGGSYLDQIEHVTDRPGHDRRYAIDAGKIARDLDWVPQETFETGIHKTISWYLNNLDWCASVARSQKVLLT